MKERRIEDHWRRLGERGEKGPLWLDRLEYEDILGLRAGAVHLQHPIIAVCGTNGVGKSTLLSVVTAILAPQQYPEARKRVAGGKASLSMRYEGASMQVSRDFDAQDDADGGDLPSLTVINAAQRAPEIIEWANSEDNLDELLAQHEPKHYDSNDLATISYLVGRDYSAAVAYELDDFDEQHPFPYFRVEADGAKYGAETMSLGEVSLFWTHWALQRAAPRSIVLLEEPETYISPRSQERVLDMVATRCDEKALTAIVTTHSSAVIGRVPREAVRLAFRAGGKVTVLEAPTDAQLRSAIGMAPPQRHLVFVEDSVAKCFLRHILQASGTDLLDRVVGCVAGSDGDIKELLKRTPVDLGGTVVVGCFDADLKVKADQLKKELEKKHWPYVFLPGDAAPEVLLRKTAKANVTRIAAEVGRAEDSVAAEMGALEGMDHHDWLVKLAQSLRLSVDSLIETLTTVWLENEAAQQECDAFIAELGAAFTQPAK